jgi:co-chaperonin GroES (HSP10)
MSENHDQIPFTPVGGRVLVRQLPYKPSKIIEVCNIDRADENEGIVAALSECQYGRKFDKRKGWEHNGLTFPHSVKVGDRVFFEGSYQDSDTMTFNGVKYRCLDSWEIKGVLHAPQPEGYRHPITGELIPEAHPIHILGE